MKKIRIISAVLAILLAFSAVSLPVFAADPVDIASYPTTEYETMYEKLSTMKEMYVSDEYGYKMYFDTQSGEFAIENTKTGELTFSNPYDIATLTESSSSDKDNDDPIRQALLSQIILQYEDTMTGATATMMSYTHAALAGGQIQFKNIDNGVRVEYALGTVETKRLIPQWIKADRFQSQILDVLALHESEFTSEELQVYNGITKTQTFYKLVGPASEDAVYDPQITPTAENPDSIKFLVDNKGETMYFLLGIGERAKKNIEKLIRKYCPEYTYDKLEEDHEITGYEGDEKEPPLFRLAVEYTINEDGLTASIPAKSIRYNETNYVLENLVLLPYFGCTTLKAMGLETLEGGKYTKNGGYIFIPDGSGTLLTYYNADGTVKSGIQGGSLYGPDYAYEDLQGTDANAEVFRIPVFGLTETSVIATSSSRGDYKPIVGNKTDTKDYARGFFAIIEEGESFASIRANLRQTGWTGASGTTEYSTVYALFTIKQSDSVTVGSSLGGSNSAMTATNSTKYTGNYTIRYVLLSDPTMAKAKGVDYYEPSYVGMADAYRDYLIESGAIDELASSEVEKGIPLYIHSFGALDTEDTFLSFPVTVEKPLTTFEDVITMADQLKENGITNVNFILEGFANGNMTKPYYPSYVKWGKTVGGTKGLETLLSYADETGIGVFPEFNFSTVSWTKAFTGFSYRKYAARAMSGRYTTRRDYDPVYQIITRFGMGNVVSSGAYLTLFEKFAEDYEKYEIGAIASTALGTDLSSDYNEDYPITREDSKLNTQDLLAAMKEQNGKVLVAGGNAYTLPYVTDIVNLPLDNSNYQISSNSIPFIGLVLHGYMNYAGGVINTEGDVQYEILKSLENGAALYFLLSYQNISEIKSAYMMGLNENYSVAYETWADEVMANYKTLNDAIGSLQTAQITNHEFVTAFRLEGDQADFMFTQSNVTRQNLADIKQLYLTTRDEVDRLRRNGLETNAQALLEKETAYLTSYNEQTKRVTLETAFTDKYATGGVVSVTYTDDNGNDTVFYINYNTYAVAVQNENGVFMIGAESFVNEKDAAVSAITGIEYETVSCLLPTAGQLDAYETALANYDAAVASGNKTQIGRTLNALNKALDNIKVQVPTNHVVKLTNANGDVAYFNYTTETVLVPLSETHYFVIPAQSYVMD
ncbi:MAG: hypothetical protein IJV98_07780 [Clostridia bacterium]|nr:hypothetical protein [Clostridia bacterium]